MENTTTTPMTGADELAIRDVVSRAQQAQNDLDALPAMHTPGVAIVNIAGRRVLGREEFATAMAEALVSPLRHIRTTVEVVDIRSATPDVAIVSCIKTVHDGRPAADASAALPTTGALTYVMAKSGGSWQIALAQTTPILAPPAVDN